MEEGTCVCFSVNFSWFCFLLLPRISFIHAEVASTLHEVSGGCWMISRILVRSKDPLGLLWDDWEDHMCFSPAPICVSSRGLFPHLQRGRWLTKYQMQPKPARAPVVLIESYREKQGGDRCCSLQSLSPKKVVRGWAKDSSGEGGKGEETSKGAFWALVIHLGTSILALKMFLELSARLLESGQLLWAFFFPFSFYSLSSPILAFVGF